MKFFILNIISLIILGKIVAKTAISITSTEKLDISVILNDAKISSNDSPVTMRYKFINYLKKNSQDYLKDKKISPSKNPYFNLFPMPVGAAFADKDSISFIGTCFQSIIVKSSTQTEDSYLISVTSSSPLTDSCQEKLWFGSVSDIQRVTIETSGTSEFTWTLPNDIKDSEIWDIETKGIRVFKFMTDYDTTIANLLETVLLFIPELTKQVDPLSARRNVDFMGNYPKFIMKERDPLINLPPSAKEVHSGDFFGIIRLDGLDPMLAWAMGSTTGHTTTALWIDDELFICESTVTDSYWPTNGIQKTPYLTWIKQAEEAGYNVIHAPINKETRNKYNVSAAIDFFNFNEGLDYGYSTMLWGWLDTITDNYPCVPDDYSSVCLTYDILEVIFGNIDLVMPELTNLFINQAWNKRISTENLNFPDILYQGALKGIDGRTIPTIPEDDSWLYKTVRNGSNDVILGKSMVCCVFVCNMWKAGGVFDDMAINCGEMTNWDDYSLTIFEDKYSQIIGRWSLELNNYKSKDSYPHMAETCSSLAPDYNKESNC